MLNPEMKPAVLDRSAILFECQAGGADVFLDSLGACE